MLTQSQTLVSTVSSFAKVTSLSVFLSIALAVYAIGTATSVHARTLLQEQKEEQEHKQTPTIVTQHASVLAVEDYNADWFTQGLYQEGDTIYISSGLYGRSALIKQSKTPRPKQQHYRLHKRYFAEGLTVIDDTLYLLTWKENTLLLFNKHTLKPFGKKNYQGEAWGLTHTPKTKNTPAEFIMSNGSNTLSFRDIETFKENRQLTIKNLDLINELEYVNGTIWANRWYDNHLYGINNQTGCIVAKIDLLPLRKKATTINNKNVVNGVSYDKEKNGLWVTGKYWNKRFLIELPSIKNTAC